jgi:DNA-binding PadR family transcriptional regulator
LLILTSLAAEPKHGYAILKDVSALGQGRVQMSTGTLYGALRRLLDEGWIERYLERAERDRQAYRLTATGRAVLEAEAARLHSLAAAASERLSLGGVQ